MFFVEKPVVRALSTLVPVLTCLLPLLVESQALAKPLTWAESLRRSQTLQWDASSQQDNVIRSLPWKSVERSKHLAFEAPIDQALGSTPGADSSTQDGPSAEPLKPSQQSSWIVGLGGGARIGTGEPTYPLVYARLGHKIDKTVSLSLRPRYIFGNSDLQGRSNNEGAFEMPLTLDVKATSWLSPYLGGGIATNTDSTGQTNGMLSLGADISITRNLAIDIGVNYIFQPKAVDSDGGDFEISTAVYYRF